LEVAALPLLLDVNPGFLRQAPVMSLEVLDPPLLELERDVLRPAPSVREDQRRAALLDEAREEIVHPRVRLLQCILREIPDGTQDGGVEGLRALALARADPVDDDPLAGREALPKLRRGEDERQRLRRRDEDVGGLPGLALPLLSGRVAGT